MVGNTTRESIDGEVAVSTAPSLVFVDLVLDLRFKAFLLLGFGDFFAGAGVRSGRHDAPMGLMDG